MGVYIPETGGRHTCAPVADFHPWVMTSELEQPGGGKRRG
jgi:hypothetical protein